VGGKLLAVSVDPPQRSFQVIQRYDLNYPILGDVDCQVIRQYGLVHAGGAPDGGDMAIPAQFLIDRTGQIVWRRVSARIQDRANPQTVIDTIRRLIPV
jgi:peroxiredoxin